MKKKNCKFVLALVITSVALAQTPHPKHHPPGSAAGYAGRLEAPSRAKWQQPEKVIQTLALRPDEVVADIGAGTGYFTRRLAAHAAKVYAVDIEADMLAKTRASSPGNVETVLATPDDPKLPPASVDTIFICDVLHHIHDRSSYYRKLAASLKPGGRLVIVDFYKKKLPVGPPVSMKITPGDVVSELESAGFKKVAAHDFLPYQYFLEFRRR